MAPYCCRAGTGCRCRRTDAVAEGEQRLAPPRIPGAVPYAATCLASRLTQPLCVGPDSYGHIGAGDDAICQGRGRLPQGGGAQGMH
eukprot:COSAG01_NODE_153_length_23909_cov_32.542018_22_plen_86_part_00